MYVLGMVRSKFPNPLYIDTEGSTKHMDVRRLPDPDSWTMLIKEIEYVRDNLGLCQTLVIDTADWAEMLCISHITAINKWTSIESPGYGKGYVVLQEEFGRMLNLLSQLIDRGINVVLTAHSQMRKFEQPDELGAYDRWELKLQRKTASMVKEWADLLLFANYKTYVVNIDGQGAAKGKNKAQGGKRVMYTSHHPAWDAKNRVGLADELPFEFSAISEHIPSINENAWAPGGPTEVISKPIEESEAAPEQPVNSEKSSSQVQSVTNREPTDNNVNDAVSPAKAEEPEEGAKKDTELEHKINDENEMPAKPVTEPVTEREEPEKKSFGNRPPGIPDALWQLMVQDNIPEELVRLCVFKQGYYTLDTPFTNYDPEFIDGVLIGAWPQVRAFAENLKKELPF